MIKGNLLNGLILAWASREREVIMAEGVRHQTAGTGN